MKTTLPETRSVKGSSRKLVQILRGPIALGLVIISTSCAGDRYARSTGESVDDTATTGRVKKALSADTTCHYEDVKVMTFKGTVQLSGFVNSTDEKAKATELAKATPGVKEVQNRISVK
jgi:osmotically-inducible protein OsmY